MTKRISIRQLRTIIREARAPDARGPLSTLEDHTALADDLMGDNWDDDRADALLASLQAHAVPGHGFAQNAIERIEELMGSASNLRSELEMARGSAALNLEKQYDRAWTKAMQAIEAFWDKHVEKKG